MNLMCDKNSYFNKAGKKRTYSTNGATSHWMKVSGTKRNPISFQIP